MLLYATQNAFSEITNQYTHSLTSEKKGGWISNVSVNQFCVCIRFITFKIFRRPIIFLSSIYKWEVKIFSLNSQVKAK